MKKILFTFLLCFTGILIMKAECSYKELKELNAFASHVETSYKYNEETGLFDLTVTNLGDKAFISESAKSYFPTDGQLIVSRLVLGKTYKFFVQPTNQECMTEKLRTITINVPYLNSFYGSAACNEHQNLSVCNSRFLSYKLSEKTFLKLLQNDVEKKDEEIRKDDEIKEPEPTMTDKIKSFIIDNYIKIILPIITVILSVSVYKIILRKIKHGI